MVLIFASVLSKKCGSLLSKLIEKPVCLSRPQLQSIRFASGRNNCATDGLEPRCSSAKLDKSPCMERKRKEKIKPNSPFKSMWENPECCNDPCPHVLPRFDELYYRISDKAKRKYFQTWVECPKRKIVPKVICNYEKLKLAPMQKRKKGLKPKTACKPDECKSGSKNVKCLTINSPGCAPGRHPPKCGYFRKPSGCKKVCPPYPSFSECSMNELKKVRPVECLCLKARSQCTMFEYLRKQHRISAKKS